MPVPLVLPDRVPPFVEPYLPSPAHRHNNYNDNNINNHYNDSISPSIEYRKPFLTLTYAASLDSLIAAKPGTQTHLSGSESKALTHYLRSRHDAILIGISTALADDPGLNCRLPTASQPRPIILDPSGRWRPTSKSRVIETATKAEGKGPWVLSSAIDEMREEILNRVGGKTLVMGEDGRWDWDAILRMIYNEGVLSVMVEGGSVVINELLAGKSVKLVDSIIVTIAPVYLGRGGVSVLPDATGKLKDVEWCVLGRDVVLAGRPDITSTGE